MPVKQSRYSWLPDGYMVVMYKVEVKLENLTLSSIATQNNRDLNQGVLHLWSKFGDPSLNGWWVIARTNLVMDGRRDVGTDGQTGATTIPEGQNWPRVKKAKKGFTETGEKMFLPQKKVKKGLEGFLWRPARFTKSKWCQMEENQLFSPDQNLISS